MAKKYHPDSSENNDPEKFKTIVEAYEILGDKEQKKIYDEMRLAHSPNI
jgi:DnaJ-class molecular chaperone